MRRIYDQSMCLQAQMLHAIATVHGEGAHKKKITGKGIGVAILDTGITPHPDFDNRIIGFCDFLKNRSIPYDDNGHGTHVAGIIGGSGAASEGKIVGMAPGCNLISLKVLDRKGNGSLSNVLSGLNWIVKNKDRYGIRIVNISVGALAKKGMGEDSILVRSVEEVWDQGLVVVVAAGNLGPGQSTITTPGISRKVITVGCSDDAKMVEVFGTKMVHYSGRGPTRDCCIVKPEIVAPGSNIISCNGLYQKTHNYYAVKSGTSMSTPIVSGAIALLLEKQPWLTNAEVKLKLRESCDDLGFAKCHQGWGQLNVKKLLG